MVKIEIFVYNKFKTFYKIDIRDDIKDIIHLKKIFKENFIDISPKDKIYHNNKKLVNVQDIKHCDNIYILK